MRTRNWVMKAWLVLRRGADAREGPEISHVQEKPPPLEEQRYVEPGITEGVVDQAGMKERLHTLRPVASASC